jgi:hypothetical protein
MKVSIGLGTIVGYGLTAIGGAATAWATAEGASAHIAPGLLAVVTVIAGSLTTLGRMYQAAKAAAPVEVLTAKPETAVVPDVPPAAAV